MVVERPLIGTQIITVIVMLIYAKRNLCFIIFSMILASCNKEIETNIPEHTEPIEFQIQWDNQCDTTESQTRGTEINTNSLNNFGLYAYYEPTLFNSATSLPKFMNNQKVEKVSESWAYSPTMYWPKNGTLSFFGYAPYEIGKSISVTTAGTPTFDLTNPTDVALQHDFLLLLPMIDKTRSDLNTDRQLPLKFTHALSSIIFKAGVENENTESIKIKSIKINALNNKATARFKQNILAPEDNWILDWVIDQSSSEDNFELSITNSSLMDIDLKNTTQPIIINSMNGYLMVIPQTIDHSDTITIETIHGTQSKTTTIALNKLITELEYNKKYVITLTILSKVDVSITCNVEPWEINKNIEVPNFE